VMSAAKPNIPKDAASNFFPFFIPDGR
jgi:hypothetical protein